MSAIIIGGGIGGPIAAMALQRVGIDAVAHDRLRIAPGERFDVVVDFRRYPVGTTVTLKNLAGADRTAEEVCICKGRSSAKTALRYLAATLAFAAEMIHLWVVPGQLVAALLPGAFFFLVAVGQGLLGVSLLFGLGRWTLRLGMLLNLFIVSGWLLTRLVSAPELFEPIRQPVAGLESHGGGSGDRAARPVDEAKAEYPAEIGKTARAIRHVCGRAKESNCLEYQGR